MVDSIRVCEGVSELCDSYDAFILDQWGVLHAGAQPFIGVLDAITELKRRKKTLIVLSNSGKRADDNIARLKKMGFDTSAFDHVVTSGEMTWHGLKDRNAGLFEGLGDKCLLLARGGDTSIVEGTGIKLVDDVAQADFILLSGSDAPEKTLADYEAILKPAAQRRLRMICANPDMEMVLPSGLAFGSGAVAKRYADFGGLVGYIGKPHQPVFRYVQSLIPDVLPAQMLVVGDSMAHDIAGGVACNIDTCLVGTGVHGASFRNAVGLEGVERALRTVTHGYGFVPSYFIPSFRWGKPLLDRKNRKAGQK